MEKIELVEEDLNEYDRLLDDEVDNDGNDNNSNATETENDNRNEEPEHVDNTPALNEIGVDEEEEEEHTDNFPTFNKVDDEFSGVYLFNEDVSISHI